MAKFPKPKAKTEPRNEWAASIRERLPEWLESTCPENARGALSGNGAVEVLIGASKVASFLPTATGLSAYLVGATDTEVKRIERLCERAGVPEDARPPRTSKYVLVKVRDDGTLATVAEALRLHCIGRR
ncbi:MAG TPA: hypothetical protein VHI71_01930 [Actinomycetota bacterium]|nr:hypothetical protein [Actinomycetota bacterium]